MIVLGLLATVTEGGDGSVLEAGTTSPAVIGALLGALALGVATFVASGRLAPRFVGAFGLLGALAAGFGLFAALAPSENQWVGLVLFLGLFALFRLLSRFESITG
ncbi:MAG: hypothetical protein AAF547_08100 [Actinomycetota bacterium]